MFYPFQDTCYFYLLSLARTYVATPIWECSFHSSCSCAYLNIGCFITKAEEKNGYIAASAIVLKGFKKGNISYIAQHVIKQDIGFIVKVSEFYSAPPTHTRTTVLWVTLSIPLTSVGLISKRESVLPISSKCYCGLVR